MAKAKPYSVAFGKAVKQERTKQNLSQEELGLKCELDRSYISGIETGRRNPTIQAVWLIATEGLQVPLVSLILQAEEYLRMR